MPDDEDSDKDLVDRVEDLSLPRIVVEEDRILAYEENDWVGRDVEDDEVEDDEISEDDLNEEILSEVLEELVGGTEEKVEAREIDLIKEDDVYGKGDVVGGEFYSSVGYEEKNIDEAYISSEVMSVGEIEDLSRVKMSGLEISGFRDEDAEKKRERKRDEVFG